VTQDVQRPGADVGGFAQLEKAFGQSRGVDRHSGLAGEDEVVIGVRLSGELASEQLRISMPLENLGRLGVERDRPSRSLALRRAEADTSAVTASHQRRRAALLPSAIGQLCALCGQPIREGATSSICITSCRS
jgi:hypothetical protein